MLTGENLNNQLLSVIVLLLLIFALLVTGCIYHFRRIKRESFRKIQALTSAYKTGLESTQFEIQESTLQYVSREIHDNINLGLIIATMNLKNLDWSDTQQVKSQVQNSVHQLTETINGLTDLSRSLNSDLIASLGLKAAIEKEIERITRFNLFEVRFIVQGNPIFLPDRTELAIFRIIQECFTNMIKHSGTHLAHVTLDYHPRQLLLEITDHGIGFQLNEPGNSVRKNGTGLINLRSRLKTINGQMKINSILNKGTTLTFIIPYPT